MTPRRQLIAAVSIVRVDSCGVVASGSGSGLTSWKGSWDAVTNGVQSITGQLKTPAEVAKQMEADVKAARSR